jgi:hypothetical protein
LDLNCWAVLLPNDAATWDRVQHWWTWIVVCVCPSDSQEEHWALAHELELTCGKLVDRAHVRCWRQMYRGWPE